MSEEGKSRFGRFLRKLRNSEKTKNFLVFLVFVGIAFVFWVIMSLNDEVQDNFEVEVVITDVPDSVTFISTPPGRLHVTVRDKGLNLLRHRISSVPQLTLRFPEFTEGDRFRVSHASLSASLRHMFGSTAMVTSVTPDSINLIFTSLPGKRLPVELNYDVTVVPGMVLGRPKLSNSVVEVYSTNKNDTLRRLNTEKIVLRQLDKTTTVDVPIISQSGKRIIPSSIKVTFPVEQLVKKESLVNVEADNIPLGQDILFFPSKVKVVYYVPMSHYNDNSMPVKIEASFREAVNTSSDKVGIKLVSKAPYISNVELMQDSVEYTLVRNN